MQYWPIYLDDIPLLIVTSKSELPDIPKGEKSFKMNGWNPDQREMSTIDLAFKGDRDLWIFEPSFDRLASSKYTEQEYENSMVRCIDPSLESLYGQTGVVIQVIPHTDIVEADVDFGRGLGTVRLSEEQFEILPLSN